MGKMKVLVAEDNEQIATLVTQLLPEKFDNIEVCWKEDGAAAFNEFQNKDYDLVISDFQMPRKDGLWLASKIRETNTSIPIILWTGEPTIPPHADRLFDEINFKDISLLIDSVGKIYEKISKEGCDA